MKPNFLNASSNSSSISSSISSSSSNNIKNGKKLTCKLHKLPIDYICFEQTCIAGNQNNLCLICYEDHQNEHKPISYSNVFSAQLIQEFKHLMSDHQILSEDTSDFLKLIDEKFEQLELNMMGMIREFKGKIKNSLTRPDILTDIKNTKFGLQDLLNKLNVNEIGESSYFNKYKTFYKKYQEIIKALKASADIFQINELNKAEIIKRFSKKSQELTITTHNILMSIEKNFSSSFGVEKESREESFILNQTSNLDPPKELLYQPESMINCVRLVKTMKKMNEIPIKKCIIVDNDIVLTCNEKGVLVIWFLDKEKHIILMSKIHSLVDAIKIKETNDIAIIHSIEEDTNCVITWNINNRKLATVWLDKGEKINPNCLIYGSVDCLVCGGINKKCENHSFKYNGVIWVSNKKISCYSNEGVKSHLVLKDQNSYGIKVIENGKIGLSNGSDLCIYKNRTITKIGEHASIIITLDYNENKSVLISSSIDGEIKFWFDQCCSATFYLYQSKFWKMLVPNFKLFSHALRDGNIGIYRQTIDKMPSLIDYIIGGKFSELEV